ncbi:hypothetical protein HispidOSU_025999, partial [Sigmodon hispidus]
MESFVNTIGLKGIWRLVKHSSGVPDRNGDGPLVVPTDRGKLLVLSGGGRAGSDMEL